MSDSYSDPQQQGRQTEGGRGEGRGGQRGGRGGNREGGGFRIRLSDNEMRSARALQEAFNLRSTVAVLGFALRTLGQMLEDGQLEELIAQQRSQAPRGGGRRDGGGRGRRFDDDRQGGRGQRPDPFARPAKPQASVPEAEPAAADAPEDAAIESDAAPQESAETVKPAEADAKSDE